MNSPLSDTCYLNIWTFCRIMFSDNIPETWYHVGLAVLDLPDTNIVNFIIAFCDCNVFHKYSIYIKYAFSLYFCQYCPRPLKISYFMIMTSLVWSCNKLLLSFSFPKSFINSIITVKHYAKIPQEIAQHTAWQIKLLAGRYFPSDK